MAGRAAPGGAGRLGCCHKRFLPLPAGTHDSPPYRWQLLPRRACTTCQVVWEGRATCVNYTLMVVGFGLYLLVGFNSAMGRPTLMREVWLAAGRAACKALLTHLGRRGGACCPQPH
jgi:hypothetical protein